MNQLITDDLGDPVGFVVTRQTVLGRVMFDDEGVHSAREEAFLMIAREGESGSYQFPERWGGTCTVTVEISDPAELDQAPPKGIARPKRA